MTNADITGRWTRAVWHAKAMRDGGFSHQELPPYYLSGDNILWVDSVMKRLHAENESIKKAIEWAKENGDWADMSSRPSGEADDWKAELSRRAKAK